MFYVGKVCFLVLCCLGGAMASQRPSSSSHPSSASASLRSASPEDFLTRLSDRLTQCMEECNKHRNLLAKDDNTQGDEALVLALIDAFCNNPNTPKLYSAAQIKKVISSVAHDANVKAKTNFYRALLLAWSPHIASRVHPWISYSDLFFEFAEDATQNMPRTYPSTKATLPKIKFPRSFNFYDLTQPRALAYRATQYLRDVYTKEWDVVMQKWHIPNELSLHFDYRTLQTQMLNVTRSWNHVTLPQELKRLHYRLTFWRLKQQALEKPLSTISAKELAFDDTTIKKIERMQRRLKIISIESAEYARTHQALEKYRTIARDNAEMRVRSLETVMDNLDIPIRPETPPHPPTSKRKKYH